MARIWASAAAGAARLKRYQSMSAGLSSVRPLSVTLSARPVFVADAVGVLGQVVAQAQVGLVHQDRVAAGDPDQVVAVAGVDPHGPLHGRADVHLVVAAQGVDQDHLVVGLRRQQALFQGQPVEGQAGPVRARRASFCASVSVLGST